MKLNELKKNYNLRSIVSEDRYKQIEALVANRQQGFAVVLEDVHDPHNAGAVLRSCDVLGVQDVYFIFEQQKYYNPKKVGRLSSASANKWLSVHIERSTEQCLNRLKEQGYKILATVVPDNTTEDIFTANLTEQKIALVLGNEHRGVSNTVVELADRKISIPTTGMVESLNISVAAAIFIFEISRQRRQSTQDFKLTPQERQTLIDDLLIAQVGKARNKSQH